MPTNKKSGSNVSLINDGIIQQVSRRKFLGYVGATSALLATAASCKKDDNPAPPPASGSVDLGSGDIGILNYAYALEQLEAAFYTQVIATPYAGISDLEKEYLTDIRNHEVAHREFFKAAIGASAIPALEVNFATIDFTSRASVLTTAQTFEDLGVTAYNGAGQLISTTGSGPTYLTLAGQIVSIEARHAALIRDLLNPGTFANSVDANGLDTANTPAVVLAAASAFLKTTIDASHLPS